MKKKILFIIDSLVCGGAEKSLVSLLPLLDKCKYEIHLWMRHPYGDFISLIPKHIHIVAQPQYSIFEKIALRCGSLLFSIKHRLNRILANNEHLAETFWKCQGWAMKVPKGSWDAVIAYQQGIPTYLVAEKFSSCKKFAWVNVDMFKAGYSIEFNANFYRKVDHICLVSDALYELMAEKMSRFIEKYTTVWDIINANVTRELACEEVENLKISGEQYVFVTTGRLVPEKGYDIAISAAVELKKKGVKFKWYFIGEGNERNHIEQTIKDLHLQNEVVLLGLKTNPYPYMSQADVYVQTSKFEGFGMTIAEAKILKKPIVSTNFDVVYNQISPNENGLVAEMNGISVADEIYRMITDDELRKNIILELTRNDNTTYLTEAKKVEHMLDD